MFNCCSIHISLCWTINYAQEFYPIVIKYDSKFSSKVYIFIKSTFVYELFGSKAVQIGLKYKKKKISKSHIFLVNIVHMHAHENVTFHNFLDIKAIYMKIIGKLSFGRSKLSYGQKSVLIYVSKAFIFCFLLLKIYETYCRIKIFEI